jgi:hypothetical protein
MKKPEKVETRGRPKRPPNEKQGDRSICLLNAAEKSELEAHSAKSGQSQSAILRAGLVVLGVLPPA